MAWRTDRNERLRSRSVHWILDKHKSMARQAMYFSTMVDQKDRFITEEHCNMKRAISRFEGTSNWPSRRRANTSPARLGRFANNYNYPELDLSLPPPPIVLQGHGLFEKIPEKTNTLVMSPQKFNRPVKKLPFQTLVEYMSNIRRFDQRVANEAQKTPLPSIATETRRQYPANKTMSKQVNQIKNYQKFTNQIEDEAEYFVLPKCRGLTSKSNRLPSLEYLYNKGRHLKLNAPTPTPQISRQNSYENLSDLIVKVNERPLLSQHISEYKVQTLNNPDVIKTPEESEVVNMFRNVYVPKGTLTLPEIVITPVVNKDLECRIEKCQQWKLHKLLCQRELRKREFVRLLEDIKEFIDLNEILEKKL